MEEKVLKAATVFLGCLTIVVCVSLSYFPELHARSVAAKENVEQVHEESMGIQMKEIQEPEEELSAQLKIELPAQVTEEELQYENDYLNQIIYIRFPYGVSDYFSEYRMSGTCEHIAGLSYYMKDDMGVFEIHMDKVYELSTDFSEGELCVDFLETHQVYDKVVVVDAGHGSRAAGAVKQGAYEKNIDLAVALQLKKVFEEHPEENIGVYYTRLDDSNPTLDQRSKLANNADADLFISIHNNSSSSGKMSSLNGTQVLYSSVDHSEHTSKRFAQICLDNLCAALDSRSVGLMNGDDIYIIRTSNAPVALIEVGFMTNAKELELLQDEEYQYRAAQGIYSSITQAFEEGY